MKRTTRGIRWHALLLAGLAPACASPRTGAGVDETLTPLDGSLQPFEQAFNAHPNAVRFVAVLSPT